MPNNTEKVKVADILIKRGPKAQLPGLKVGELALTTDTDPVEIYVGTAGGNKLINPVQDLPDPTNLNKILREVSFDKGTGVMVVEVIEE